MKFHQKPIWILLLLLIATSGCSDHLKTGSETMEANFQTAVPVPDMNQSLELKVDDNKSVFPNGSDIPLLAQNKSPYFLFLNLEENYIKLFTIRGTEWVEVKNGLTYSGSRILSPQGNALLGFDPTWARPELDNAVFKDNKTDRLVRIVVTGEIMENDVRTGKFVAAYVDAYLTP